MSSNESIQAALAEKPTASLEDIAATAGATVADVVRSLPDGEAVCIDGEHFVEVMSDVTGWGEITLIVNTGDVVLEARGEVPPGSLGRGYYNLHGKPIGGHLKAENCGMIAFVSRLLFGNPTHSVQFYASAGHCMFKIYLGRDEKRQIYPEQIDHFTALRDRLAAA